MCYKYKEKQSLALVFGKLPAYRAGVDKYHHGLKALLEVCIRDHGISEEEGANWPVAEKSLREGQASEL